MAVVEKISFNFMLFISFLSYKFYFFELLNSVQYMRNNNYIITLLYCKEKFKITDEVIFVNFIKTEHREEMEFLSYCAVLLGR